MRFYETLSLTFYLAFALLAWFRPLQWRRRIAITGLAAAGVGAVVAVPPAIRDWLPLALIPMAYWQTGRFVRPLNTAFQAQLQAFDQKVLLAFIRFSFKNQTCRSITFVLEAAYLFCYPLVPCGLAALYLFGLGGFAEEFWNVVLPPAYLCYATFPFVQTLPPRAIEQPGQPQRTRIRRLNLFVLRHISIQANTFPSGHVAASVAIALELLRLAPPAGIVFLFIAIGISAGAFVGRYHYGVDILAGALLAVLSFLAA